MVMLILLQEEAPNENRSDDIKLKNSLEIYNGYKLSHLPPHTIDRGGVCNHHLRVL